MSLTDEILSRRCPDDLLSNGGEYRAGFRAGYEEARREFAELVRERESLAAFKQAPMLGSPIFASLTDRVSESLKPTDKGDQT